MTRQVQIGKPASGAEEVIVQFLRTSQLAEHEDMLGWFVKASGRDIVLTRWGRAMIGLEREWPGGPIFVRFVVPEHHESTTWAHLMIAARELELPDANIELVKQASLISGLSRQFHAITVLESLGFMAYRARVGGSLTE